MKHVLSPRFGEEISTTWSTWPLAEHEDEWMDLFGFFLLLALYENGSWFYPFVVEKCRHKVALSGPSYPEITVEIW